MREEREELVRSLEAERVLLEETRLIQKALEEKREAIGANSEEMEMERWVLESSYIVAADVMLCGVVIPVMVCTYLCQYM